MKGLNVYLRFSILLALYFSSAVTYSADLKFITLGVAPWAYFDEERKEFLGVFPDLIKEVESRTGHNISISLAPFNFERINRELELGRQDCTMVIVDKKRKIDSVIGESVLDLPMGVIARKDIVLEKYEDLEGVKISVLKPLSEHDKFMGDPELNKEIDPNYEIGLRKILHGRLDAIAGAIPTIMFLARKNGLASVLGKPLVISFDPVVLQCSKKSEKLQYMDSINKAIKDIKDDLTFEKIVNDNFWY